MGLLAPLIYYLGFHPELALMCTSYVYLIYAIQSKKITPGYIMPHNVPTQCYPFPYLETVVNVLVSLPFSDVYSIITVIWYAISSSCTNTPIKKSMQMYFRFTGRTKLPTHWYRNCIRSCLMTMQCYLYPIKRLNKKYMQIDLRLAGRLKLPTQWYRKRTHKYVMAVYGFRQKTVIFSYISQITVTYCRSTKHCTYEARRLCCYYSFTPFIRLLRVERITGCTASNLRGLVPYSSSGTSFRINRFGNPAEEGCAELPGPLYSTHLGSSRAMVSYLPLQYRKLDFHILNQYGRG